MANATSDVIDVAKLGQPRRDHDVVFVDMLGNIQKRQTTNINPLGSGSVYFIEADLTNNFNHPTYY